VSSVSYLLLPGSCTFSTRLHSSGALAPLGQDSAVCALRRALHDGLAKTAHPRTCHGHCAQLARKANYTYSCNTS
jgi:hypothetical protein